MTGTAFWHLAWKEYRVNRAYWLALVVLTVLCEFGIASTQRGHSHDSAFLAWALAVPAFFAVGSAGMAFAIEREEETIEFLRARPVSPGQLVASKLAVTLIATLGLYVLLVPISLWFSGGQVPNAIVLGPMICFWGLAALGAIVWGTLFSLLGARPLMAIFQAGIVDALVLTASIGLVHERSVDSYDAGVRWGVVVSLVVLAVDVYLALAWLQRQPRESWLNSVARYREQHALQLHVQPLRSLLWQQWRQSARTIAALSTLAITAASLARIQEVSFAVVEPLLVAIAAVMGCFVFRGDQEKHGYRFFVEHNVSPRLVWLTRLMVWLPCFIVTAAVAQWIVGNWSLFIVSSLPITGFAIGQWASMLVRSPLLAATASIGLSAIVCFWAFLIWAMALSGWWSIVPIPLALFVATWWRAPDWVTENQTWKARARAAAIGLVPVALLVAVPIARMVAIRSVWPGFDPDAVQLSLDSNTFETEQLLIQAGQQYIGSEPIPSPKWFSANGRSLALVLEAASHPHGMLFDRRTAKLRDFKHAEELIMLVAASGSELEKKGQLDAAFARLMTALRLNCELRLFEYSAGYNLWWTSGEPTGPFIDRFIYRRISDWAAEKGQTTARLEAAAQQLRRFDSSALELEQKIECNYIYSRDRIEAGAGDFYSPEKMDTEPDGLLMRYVPTERARALRMINLQTATALGRLRTIRQLMSEGKPIVHYVRTDLWNYGPPSGLLTWNSFFTERYDSLSADEVISAEKDARALEATYPGDIRQLGYLGLEAASELAEFETSRRAELLLLEIQSYRLKHGALPKSLDEIIEPGLPIALHGADGSVTQPASDVAVGQDLPRDPYSGFDFYYFPEGTPGSPPGEPFPTASTPASDASPMKGSVPCIWSPGADLTVSGPLGTGLARPTETEVRTSPTPVPRREFRRGLDTIWDQGLRFPLPGFQTVAMDQQTATADNEPAQESKSPSSNSQTTSAGDQSSTDQQTANAADDVADVPSHDLRAGGNQKKRFFLIGPRIDAGKPPKGFALLVVLPGGDGSADFEPFVKRILKFALPKDYLIAEPVAVPWDPAADITWPTKKLPVKGMKFTTEEFVDAVIKDAAKKHTLDPQRIFTLSWSSSGHAAYSISLTNKKITGSLIAMSVFNPKLLPPLTAAKGQAYYLLHSPDDTVCPIWMARMAVNKLKAMGATITLATYKGGHGWNDDPFKHIREGIDWLEQNHATPAKP